MTLGDDALREITTVCAAFDVDGLRADLVTARAAVALAAWAGRDEVTTDDVRQAVLLALPHRRRRTPFEEPGLDESRLDEALEQARAQAPDSPTPDPDDDGGGPACRRGLEPARDPTRHASAGQQGCRRVDQRCRRDVPSGRSAGAGS